MITGELLVQADGIDHVLSSGDSIYIYPSIPHGYLKRETEPCRALVVTSATPAAAQTVAAGAKSTLLSNLRRDGTS